MGCGAACVASIVKYAGGNISLIQYMTPILFFFWDYSPASQDWDCLSLQQEKKESGKIIQNFVTTLSYGSNY